MFKSVTALLMLLCITAHAYADYRQYVSHANIALTPEERVWLDSKSEILLYTARQDSMPFIYTDKGILKGYLVDLIEQISVIMDHPIEIIRSDDLETTLALFEEGKIDGFVPVVITQNRLDMLLFSTPLLTEQLVAVVPDAAPPDTDILAIPNLQIGIVNNMDNEASLLSPTRSQVLISRYLSHKDLLEALQFGMIDTAVGSKLTLQKIIAQQHISGYKLIPLHAHAEFHSAIATDKRQPLLISVINKALAAIPPATFMHLRSQWLLNTSALATADLSVTEQQYLAQLPSIHYCIDPYWTPLEWQDEGRHAGLSADLLDYIKSRLPVDFELYPTQSWQESLDALADNRCQLLTMASPTQTRMQKMLFTQPYIKNPMVIVTSESEPFIADASRIGSKEYGFVAGYAVEELLRVTYPNLKLTAYPSGNAAYRAAQRQEIDGVIENYIVASYHLGLGEFPGMKIAGQLNMPISLAMAVNQATAPLQPILDKILADMPAQQKKAIFSKWSTIEIRKTVDKATIAKTVLIAMALLFTLFFWNQHLRRINQRLREAKAALSQSNAKLATMAKTDPLTGIGNRAYLDHVMANEIERARRYNHPLSVLLLDVDHFKKINDRLGHQAGDQALILTAKRLQLNIRRSDSLGRWGGEEFLIICPETTLEQASILAEKLRNAIANEPLADSGKQTISIGVSALGHDNRPEPLIARADEAMYRAKNKGRNCVVSNKPPPD